MRNIKLFCFPCAGGTASFYSRWKKYLKDGIELRPVEMSGRGKRKGSKLYETFDEAVEDLYKIIKEETAAGDYAFFGHSMGSWMAYEIAQKIMQDGRQSPLHIFFAGRKAPHIKYTGTMYHKLPDDAMRAEMAKMGSMNDFFTQSDDVFNMYLPVVRSDCRIIENYEYVDRGVKLDSDVTVIYGDQDVMTHGDEEMSWRQHTKKDFRLYTLNSGHFFILDRLTDVVDIINERLEVYI